jgi:hypothetical protein
MFDLAHDPDWQIEARGTINHDVADACDPCTTTYAIRAGAALWLHGLAANLDDPTRTIEAHLAEYLADHHRPDRCGCAHDCCGHRHGWAEAHHVTGPLFLVRVHTSRNY